ncbi:hypothetical protein PYCCODRAFT_1365254 [Trametes coccinea BRFM310]|uniref:Fe2OG dioxygenase domain-containing protein n=1 Tax=Trametes coccinea (strain BRFM310) TaxID=1353009 RepID=A0A1Y2IRQ9_TRAC3|nr:hypothetical protein PYCCODRAFT_1365254 [Trametes coccinea BRFM310]
MSETESPSFESSSELVSTVVPKVEPKVDPILEQKLDVLRSAIQHKAPFCQGVVPLAEDDSYLFYGKDSNARRINIAKASVEEVQRLAETCDPATFGVNQQDVYDETYRKAGKLDRREFALNFSPEQSGMLDAVRDSLLVELHAGSRVGTEPIRMELYKLNVYGKCPQSFFKAHVDTPRSELMFGSLVMVLPITHEGGALVLRERDKENIEEWTFDSSALLAQCNQPSIAYVAFFSDVEHEVLPVQSGYRVTITYNLYHVQQKSDAQDVVLPSARPVPTNEEIFRSVLRGLLDAPEFLPNGGNLLFCLHHQYPLSNAKQPFDKARQALIDVTSRLKGSDAMIFKVLRELSLDTAPKVVYEDATETWHDALYVMCDHVVPLDNEYLHSGSLAQYLVSTHKGILLNEDPDSYISYRDGCDPPAAKVYWIAPTPWRVNSDKATFIHYGNEAKLAHSYWKVSLFVRIGPAGSRATVASDAGATPVQP